MQVGDAGSVAQPSEKGTVCPSCGAHPLVYREQLANCDSCGGIFWVDAWRNSQPSPCVMVGRQEKGKTMADVGKYEGSRRRTLIVVIHEYNFNLSNEVSLEVTHRKTLQKRSNQITEQRKKRWGEYW